MITLETGSDSASSCLCSDDSPCGGTRFDVQKVAGVDWKQPASPRPPRNEACASLKCRTSDPSMSSKISRVELLCKNRQVLLNTACPRLRQVPAESWATATLSGVCRVDKKHCCMTPQIPKLVASFSGHGSISSSFGCLAFPLATRCARPVNSSKSTRFMVHSKGCTPCPAGMLLGLKSSFDHIHRGSLGKSEMSEVKYVE